MPQRSRAQAAAAAALGVCLIGTAHAVDWRPDAIEVQGGVGQHAAS
ncbi:MAG: hypothetical protein JWP43_3356, partial [Ramlibacter sp.]|nr:hypothetical protein [Ramlibacter sp.]